jgi:AcrR family transcriptional regulator
MQERSGRRSNQERTDATRAALITAARRLFVEKSFAETSTTEIVAAAKVTRGALYHHFEDKRALFHAVVEQEAAAVAAEIDAAAPATEPVREALVKGGEAFLEAMARDGRTRLLLIDGPAVLGRAAMDEIDSRNGARTLREGLAAAIGNGEIAPLPLDALTALLSAAFDRAALGIEENGNAEVYCVVLSALIHGLAPR